jgi:hypothetical protein
VGRRISCRASAAQAAARDVDCDAACLVRGEMAACPSPAWTAFRSVITWALNEAPHTIEDRVSACGWARDGVAGMG